MNGRSPLVGTFRARDAHPLVFHAARGRRRFVGRIHNLGVRHQHLEAQRRRVSDRLHAVDEALRHLHQESFRRDERLDAFDRESDLPALHDPERAVVLMEAARGLRAGRHRNVGAVGTGCRSPRPRSSSVALCAWRDVGDLGQGLVRRQKETDSVSPATGPRFMRPPCPCNSTVPKPPPRRDRIRDDECNTHVISYFNKCAISQCPPSRRSRPCRRPPHR